MVNRLINLIKKPGKMYISFNQDIFIKFIPFPTSQLEKSMSILPKERLNGKPKSKVHNNVK